MGEAPMVGECERLAAKASQHVQIGSFRCQRKRQRGQRRFAIQPGAAHTCAGQEMSERFQVLQKILAGYGNTLRLDVQLDGASSVNASGTTVITAGSVPSNSPSAST